MKYQKTVFRVRETDSCPQYHSGDEFVVSGIAVLMNGGEEASTLVTTTVIHNPPGRHNCNMLYGDFNRLVIEHERADLIPGGTYPCSGCDGSIILEHNRSARSEVDAFLLEGEQAAGMIHLLRNFPFFRNIDRSDLESVVKSFSTRTYQKNEIIIRRGERGDNFYVIASGRIAVLNEAGIPIATLSSGDVFGEMSLLGNESASATVQATEESEVLYIDNREFKRLLDDYPLLQRYFTRLLAKRLSQANRFKNIDFVSIITGRLEEFPPEALFQSLHSGRKTGILTITDVPGGTARFSVRQGSLIRATYGNKKGKSAFYDIFREKKGTFKFAPGLPPEDFDAPEIGYFMKLLLTALEKADRAERSGK